MIYGFIVENKMSETAFIHCQMMGDELLLKRSPNKIKSLL